MKGTPAPGIRQTTVAMRWLLFVAAGLVTLAGIQLFVLSEHTDRYFSWTIGVPLTAAFLGAQYWASMPLSWLSGRERVWARCRPAVSGVFVFTALTLVVTLLHLELFHFGDEFPLETQVVTWAWLAVYVVVPVLFLVILVDQLRRPGGDPPRGSPFPSWMRLVMGAQAAIMLVLGAALFLAPTDAASWWPWPLTPLTGRAVGAWLLALAVIEAELVVENDFVRGRSVIVSAVAMAVLQLVNLARYSSTVDWSPKGWIYMLFVLGLLVVGTYGVHRGRQVTSSYAR